LTVFVEEQPVVDVVRNVKTPLGRTVYEPSRDGPLTPRGPTGTPFACTEPSRDPVSTILN
jgi:hypothetical protein